MKLVNTWTRMYKHFKTRQPTFQNNQSSTSTQQYHNMCVEILYIKGNHFRFSFYFINNYIYFYNFIYKQFYFILLFKISGRFLGSDEFWDQIVTADFIPFYLYWKL